MEYLKTTIIGGEIRGILVTLEGILWSSGYSNWIINGPHENETLIFECILNNENDNQPLKWAKNRIRE